MNDLSRRQLAAVGIDATVVYNTFDIDEPPGATADAPGTRSGSTRRRA